MAKYRLNLLSGQESNLAGGKGCRRLRMNHQWHDTMVDQPDADGPAYVTGWTISGLAVIGTILAVWVLGI